MPPDAHTTALISRFDTDRRRPSPPRAGGQGSTVVDLGAYRMRTSSAPQERSVNETWDALMELARQAWSWRDPQSVAALGACVKMLAALTAADWNEEG